jgi:hypothetical protein
MKQNKFSYKHLNKDELKTLVNTLVKEATIFESKLSSFMYHTRNDSSSPTQQKLERLWFAANTLWQKIFEVEKWRLKNEKKTNIIRL